MIPTHTLQTQEANLLATSPLSPCLLGGGHSLGTSPPAQHSTRCHGDPEGVGRTPAPKTQWILLGTGDLHPVLPGLS